MIASAFPPLLALLNRPGHDLPKVLRELAVSLPTQELPWTGLVAAPPAAILHTNDMRADLLAYLVTRVLRVP